MFEEFDALDDEEIEQVSLDVNLVKKNIPQYNSQKLCEMIVCDRYFGFNPEVAEMCMEELATRRLAGDNFDFETYIDEALKTLPPLDFSGFDIRTIIGQAIGKK